MKILIQLPHGSWPQATKLAEIQLKLPLGYRGGAYLTKMLDLVNQVYRRAPFHVQASSTLQPERPDIAPLKWPVWLF